MAIPLSYIARNLWNRRLTTALTAGGLALVVFVFATVLMLDAGLKRTLVTTGEYDNVVAIRKGTETEIQSSISRDQASIIEMHGAVASGAGGERMASRETVVLISLIRRGDNKPSDVIIRGTAAMGLTLRPQVKLTEGRMFHAGSTEIIVGSNIARRFEGTRIGGRLRFAQREWTVVGIFDAGGSGFDSEIWGDVDQLMQSFRRTASRRWWRGSRTRDCSDRLRADVDGDPRLTNEVKREQVFYSDQSRALSKFINILGLTLTVIFSIGATIGAMITMYAVRREPRRGNRHAARARLQARERIGGISRRGAPARSGRRGGRARARFADAIRLVFDRQLPDLRRSVVPLHAERRALSSRRCCSPLAMGLAGGFLPAVRAARLNIVDALRAI